jgi:hypothetical protein
MLISDLLKEIKTLVRMHSTSELVLCPAVCSVICENNLSTEADVAGTTSIDFTI